MSPLTARNGARGSVSKPSVENDTRGETKRKLAHIFYDCERERGEAGVVRNIIVKIWESGLRHIAEAGQARKSGSRYCYDEDP